MSRVLASRPTDDPSADPLALPRRLPSLAGVRVLACAVVFGEHLLHSAQLFADDGVQGALDETPALGHAALTLFFVLSGFVLTWVHRAGESPFRFWRRRFAKVMPGHVVCLAAGAALVAAYGVQAALTGVQGTWNPAAVVANLFLVHVWVPDVAYLVAANPVTWSLACEALFYVAFPLLIVLVRRVPAGRLAVCAVGTALVSAAVPVLAYLLWEPPPGLEMTLEQYWLTHAFPPARLPEFVLGMLLAQLIAGGWRPPAAGPAGVLVLATVVATTQLPAVFGYGPLHAGPVALYVAALAYRDVVRQPGLLTGPRMLRLAEYTFAAGVCHYVVIMYVRKFVADDPAGYDTPVAAGVVLLVTALTLAVSWVLYRFVERPVVRLARPRRAAAPAGAVPAQRRR